MEVPAEFDELLEQDKEGRGWFDKLSPGKKRTLIYFVSSVKNSDKRLLRSLVVLNHLKTEEGVIDFKKLNIEMKEANRKGWV